MEKVFVLNQQEGVRVGVLAGEGAFADEFLSGHRTFEIETQECDLSVRLKWQNPRGGMDSYTFISKKTQEVRHRPTTFEKPLSVGFGVEDRGETVKSVKSFDNFEVFSRNEPRATIEWLAEIGANMVNVFIDDGTDLIPVVVTSRKTKIVNTDKELFKVSVKYMYANKRKGQRN